MPTNIAITEHVVQELPSERPLVRGEKYKVMQSDGTLIEYVVNSQGEPVFVRGITDEQNGRLNRLTTEEISKVESITTGDITKLKEDYTKEQIDTKISDLGNLASSSKVSLGNSTVLPVPPQSEGVTIPNAWVELAQNVTYTQAGGSPITGIDGHRSIAEWDNDNEVWSLVDMGELPQPEVSNAIIKDGKDAISQGGIYSTLDTVMVLTENVEFKLMPGEVIANGTIGTSVNWLRTDKLKYYTEKGIVNVSGVGRGEGNESFLNSKRMACWDISDNFLGFVTGVDGRTSMSLQPLPNTDTYIIHVDSGINVGVDPENSPFNQNMKIFYGEVSENSLKAESIKGNIMTPQIRSLEDAVKTSTLSGNGAPRQYLGGDGSVYIDIASSLVYKKRGNLWGNGEPFAGQKRKVSIPEDFGWFPFDVYKLSSNGIYVPSVTDISNCVMGDILSFTPYYIDPVNGSDSNDGLTPETAFNRVKTAIDLGAQLIYCMEGDYNRAQGIATPVITRNTAIIAYNGANVNMSSWDDGNIFTWTTDDNAYSTTRSGVVSVIDNSVLNSDGYYTFYKQVETLQECKDTPGSWFLSGSTLSVNTLNGEQPSSRIKVNLLVETCRLSVGADIDFIYLEGITSYACGNNEYAASIKITNNTTTQYDGNAYVKDCIGVENRLGNGIQFADLKEVYVQNSGSVRCRKDSLNYHTNIAGYEKMKVVEINCWSLDTGYESEGESSSNGSTAHDGMQIIRFGGNFQISRGSTVVDVNTGIRSLNYNVEAGGSYLPNTGAFHIQSGLMWLFGCYGHTSTLAARADGGSGTTLYYDADTLLDGDIFGNVIPVVS